MERGVTITLKPITHKGKNRIREHGDQWKVLDISNDNRVLVTPIIDGEIRFEGYLRWVFLTKDPHFEIEQGCIV